MKKIASIVLVTLFVLSSISSVAVYITIALTIEESTTSWPYNYDVPILDQTSYTEKATNGLPIGWAACGPTSMAMLLRYYFPNSMIEGDQIYHSGTQNYAKHTTAINYQPDFAGMVWKAAEHYLNRIWGGNAQWRSVAVNDPTEIIAEIKRRPLLIGLLWEGRAKWSDKNGDGKIQSNEIEEYSGHIMVLRGYDDRSTPQMEDDLFLLNDPWKGQVRTLSYSQLFGARAWHILEEPVLGYNIATDTGWFGGNFLTFDPVLDESMRKYTVIVDNHKVELDDKAAKDEAGNFVWWEWYHYYEDLAGNWYYPKAGGHSAKWVPNLAVDGVYEIHVIFRKDLSQSDVNYTICAPDDKEIGYKIVNQTGRGWADVSLGTFYLKKGSFVKVKNVPVNCNVDAVRFVYTGIKPVDLVLVLDRSGSMASYMGTKTRLDGAKEAAIAVINVLMSYDRVAVVSFDNLASINIQLTSDFEKAKNEIQKITTGGTTSFGAGLSSAINELKSRGSKDHIWAIIFMSDGWHNTDPPPDPYVAECKNLGVPIYTVGLGQYPTDVNEQLLKWMASETGGKYLFAPSLYDLQNIFIRFSLQATGWTPTAEFSGIVGEGQTVVAGTFDVPPHTTFVRVTLNWPGSDLDLIIVRPDGTEVELGTGSDNTYSGATVKPEWVILHNPQPGTWTVKVYGKVINSPDEPYIVWISVYAPPAPHDTTPPTTSLTMEGPQYVDPDGKIYVTSTTKFTLRAEDNIGGSGVKKTFYKIYNSSYNTNWLEYSTPFYLIGLADGQYTIGYYSIDNADNVESTKTTTVTLDTTPPTTTLTIGEPKYSSNATYVTQNTPLTLEANDKEGSGVYSIAYRIYNGAYDSGWQRYIASFCMTGLADGVYIIEFNSTDNLGNTEPTKSIQVTLFSWNYVFEDTDGRGTILKINLAHKFLQFITPDKDYGIKEVTYMRQCGRAIIIHYYDDELRLITTSVDTKLDFCVAIAWDQQTGKRYFLIDKAGKE
jgi:Mg-chelatase subunit ChlD